jgi:hypothetical protein
MLAEVAVPNELRVPAINAAVELTHGRLATDAQEYSPGVVELKAGPNAEYEHHLIYHRLR